MGPFFLFLNTYIIQMHMRGYIINIPNIYNLNTYMFLMKSIWVS